MTSRLLAGFPRAALFLFCYRNVMSENEEWKTKANWQYFQLHSAR